MTIIEKMGKSSFAAAFSLLLLHTLFQTCVGFHFTSGCKRIRTDIGFNLKMGIRSRFASIFRRKSSVKRSDEELKEGIAKFYDESSSIWLDVWVSMEHANA